MKRRAGEDMNKSLRLSKKTAKEIIRKVFGTVIGSLEKDKTNDEADIYRMNIGELSVTVQNDWFEKNGLFVVHITAPLHSVNDMRLYFEPETLAENIDAEYRWRITK